MGGKECSGCCCWVEVGDAGDLGLGVVYSGVEG